MAKKCFRPASELHDYIRDQMEVYEILNKYYSL